jgi:ATP-dependent helicase HrpB
VAEDRLPIDEVLLELLRRLEQTNTAILVAPPGAGKTTRVPPALLDCNWCTAKVLVLVPRRIAARAAASFVAGSLGEPVGKAVGYRVRLESRVSAATRIEYITEGIFTRRILDDPELAGVSAVLFDEFHERNLDADLGLALALDAQAALRPDLRILVMSATLDTAQLARLLPDAPVVESAGRAFPVELRYRDRPAATPIEDAVAEAVRDLVREETGSLLAFLPGRAEIAKTAERLTGRLPQNCTVHKLHGGIEPREQDAAIRPASMGQRKIVLATSIAETSLTIDGVRLVVDSGLARVPRYEPDTGLTRLETVRVSKSSIVQRAGRAGRTAPGIALRLWREAATAGLPERPAPEIRSADLTGLALDLATIGVRDPQTLRWLDSPPEPAWKEAIQTLQTIGAIDDAGAATELGRRMRGLALPPRYAAIVVAAAKYGQAREAAEIAMLISERGLGGDSADLSVRLDRFRTDRGDRARAARTMAHNMASQAGEEGKPAGLSVGTLISLAWPERIAVARGGGFLLAGGAGANIDRNSPLAREPFLAVAELQGSAASARITAAAPISREEIELLHPDRIRRMREIEFDADAMALRPRERRMLGAIPLSSGAIKPSRGEIDAAMLAAIRKHGLESVGWDASARRMRERIAFLHRAEPARWPDVSDERLLRDLEDWLGPFLGGAMTMREIDGRKLRDGLDYLLSTSRAVSGQLEKAAPERFVTPAGASHALRYEDNQVVLAARVQEFYGLNRHPAIGGGAIPLTLELLSPALRPIQVTRDLPGFWAGSWREVRTEMRGRYPKHDWPQDPASATPSTRTKPRP